MCHLLWMYFIGQSGQVTQGLIRGR